MKPLNFSAVFSIMVGLTYQLAYDECCEASGYVGCLSDGASVALPIGNQYNDYN